MRVTSKIGMTVIVIGIGMGFFAYSEAGITFNSSEKPVEISLGRLMASGWQGNANLILTEFVPCANYVCMQPNASAPWQGVWIPLVPIEEVEAGAKSPPSPPAPKVLLFSESIRNRQQLENKLKGQQIQARMGSVLSSDWLKPKVRNLLKQAYPGLDLDHCMIIEQGKVPLSRRSIYLVTGGAVVCVAIGLALITCCYLDKRKPDLGAGRITHE